MASRATLGEQLRAQAAQTNALAITYRLADLRYRAGAASYLDALDAQRSLFTAQQALIQTQAAQLQNNVALYRALGGGWARAAGAGALNPAPVGVDQRASISERRPAPPTAPRCEPRGGGQKQHSVQARPIASPITDFAMPLAGATNGALPRGSAARR